MMIYKMRSDAGLPRVVIALTITSILLSMFVVRQTPTTARQGQNKLTARQKAKLPDEARYPVTFSPDGRTFATGARNDTAILWELQETH
jgi:hypothetical protein